MSAEAGLAQVLALLKSLNSQDLDWELRRLQGIREWALDHLGIDYRPGDRVRVVSPIPGRSQDGWRSYAECLSEGVVGEVTKIEFVPPLAERPGRWIAHFVPSREWATSDWGTERRRYWHGPSADTPDGYEPPSQYEAEKHPEGRKHTFMFDIAWLARADRIATTDGGGDRG